MSKVKIFDYSDLMSFLSWTINKNAFFYVNKFLSSENREYSLLKTFSVVHCPNVDLVARIATQLILSIVFSSLMSHFALMFELF